MEYLPPAGNTYQADQSARYTCHQLRERERESCYQPAIPAVWYTGNQPGTIRMINRSSTHYIPPLESVTRQHTTMATTTQNRDMTACRYSEERKKNLLPHKIMAFLILSPTTNRLGRHKNNSSHPIKTRGIRLKTITTLQRHHVHKNGEQIVNVTSVQLLPRLKPV